MRAVGAKAPDRNRGPAHSGPPTRRASQEPKPTDQHPNPTPTSPPENSQQLSANPATLSQNPTSASLRNIAQYTDCGGARLVRAITSCFALTMSAK